VGAKIEVLSGERNPSEPNAQLEIDKSAAEPGPEGIVHHNAATEVLQSSSAGSHTGQVLNEAHSSLSGKARTSSRAGAATDTPRPSSSKHTSENTWITISHNIGSIFKTASDLFWPIIATLLFLIVTPILIRGTSVGWPLSKLTTPMGTFVLSLVSKLTDFVLDWGADTVWEVVHWGPLLRKGEELLTFLAFTSGLGSWLSLVLFRPDRSSKDSEKVEDSHTEQCRHIPGSGQSGLHEPSARNIQNGEAKSYIEVSKRPENEASRVRLRSFRLWSLLRCVSINAKII
jgi:hypothetical protein